MKRSTVISVILAILCVSCAEEEKAFFGEISKETISFDGASNSSVQLSFKTNSQWQVVSSEDWCRVFPNSGEGNISRTHVVGVVCDDNTGKAPRECVLRFMSGQTVREVTVRQDYIVGLYLDVFEYEVGAEAGECVVDLWKDDVDITVEIPQNAGWIKHVSTKAMSPGSLVLSISENMSSARQATLTLSGGEKTATVIIRQKPSSIDIPDQVLRASIMGAFDKDGDGNISKYEASIVSGLGVPEEVHDATGVEYFYNITTFNLKSKYIHSFDFGLFPKLKSLFVSSPIDNLVIGPSETLTNLSLLASYKSIQLSSLPNLSQLILGASFSGPETVDLSGISAAFELIFSCHCNSSFILENSGIRAITTSNTTPVSDQQFMKKLILRNCPQLQSVKFYHDNGMEELICSGNPLLSELYYSGHNWSLKKVEVSDCPKLSTISVQVADLGALSLGILPALTRLICTDCCLFSLDLTSSPTINYLNCRNNPELQYVYCKVRPKTVYYDQGSTSIVVVD